MQELNLLNLPREILFEIFIRIPYDQLQNAFKTSTETREICTNWNFWNRKAQFDFEISAEEFNRTPEPDGRIRYLQMRDISELQIGSSFFKDMFELGLYLRGWRGPPQPYSYHRDMKDSYICEPIIKVSTTLNDNPDLRALTMRTYSENQFKSLDNNIGDVHTSLINRDDYQPIAKVYIITALYYLRTQYGITIPDFNIEEFIRVCSKEIDYPYNKDFW